MIKHKFLILFVALCATTALWASNTITYTATEKLSGYDGSLDVGKTTFGSPITSHTFSNGTGTITCAGEVTEIGSNAFRNCSRLTSVTIPNSVTTIGEDAFCECSGLTSVSIPQSVTTIGDRAFIGCSSLPVVDNIRYADTYLVKAVDETLSAYVIKEGTKWIGDGAFEYCSSLTSITIPNSVTAIGEVAFLNCSELTSVTIGNSVTTIGYGAFLNCSSLIKTNYTGTVAAWCKINFSGYSNPIQNSHNFFINNVELKDLVIPEGVDKIGGYAFESCSGLTSVTIPNSVTTIGYSAFYGCYGLTSVTIGNSVTMIGNSAFYGCSGLTSITCEATTPPACGDNCFYRVDKSIPLYVLAGSVDAYKAADEWKDFTDIRPISTAIENIDANVNADVNTHKFLYNGQVIIRQGDKAYNIVGREM